MQSYPVRQHYGQWMGYALPTRVAIRVCVTRCQTQGPPDAVSLACIRKFRSDKAEEMLRDLRAQVSLYD